MALEQYDTEHPEFKVVVKRIWKGYDLLSNDVERQVGAHILINNDGLPGMKVKIKKPEQEVKIEIHEDKAYVFARHEQGMGGLPIGTAGFRALFSPVLNLCHSLLTPFLAEMWEPMARPV